MPDSLGSSSCNSPIEDIFSWNFNKYVSPRCDLEKQVEVQTFSGLFVLDFLLTIDGRKIGIECDGRDFHTFERDLFRDSIIMGVSDISAIYRFRGRDINFSIADTLYGLSKVEPECFSERGSGILDQLRSHELNFFESPEVVYSHSMAGSPDIWIRSLRKNHPDEVWLRVFEFAKERKKLKLDEIVETAKRERFNYLAS